MSFTSVLPTPQILLKAKPAPPTDTAKGIDTLVSLTVYAAPRDAAKGMEALSAFSVSIPPQLDTAKAADLPALAGPSLYGYILRLVKKGDIILPDDQNNLVYAWRAKIDKLSEIESKLREANPSLADTLAAYISEQKSIVDSMPIVKEGDWVYSDHFNLHLRALRKLIEIEEWLTTEVCGSPSDMVQLLDAMKSYASQLSEKKTGDIVASADWNNLKQAMSVAPRLDELALTFAVPTIYLFKEHGWAMAKQYVDDYTIIFCWMTIPTLSADAVRQLVASKKVVFAIEVDTQPYYPYNAPAWYGVFYTVLAPRSCGMCADNVTDPDFQRFLGSRVPCDIDYNVSLSYKVSGARNWSGDSCGWGYKRYERGAIIEVPYDGYWMDADWLGKYVDAISNILLGVSRPARVLYLGHYISGNPGWHACNPIDECWKALAQARGWRVVDLRT
jgi:hypothetical protein